MRFPHIFSAQGLATYQQDFDALIHAKILKAAQNAFPTYNISTIGFHDCEHEPLMITVQVENTDLTAAQLQNLVTAGNNYLASLGLTITIKLIQ